MLGELCVSNNVYKKQNVYLCEREKLSRSNHLCATFCPVNAFICVSILGTERENEDKTAFSGDTDNTFIQFFRYVFVGGFAFVVDYGIMTALVELCRFDPVIAATISFVAGLLVNYVLSTFWIFKNSKIKTALQSLRHLPP